MPKAWQVVLLRQAKRYLEKLPENERERILDVLTAFQDSPEKASLKPLAGRTEWSLRVGSRRILLQIVQEQGKIFVTRIGSRGDVYKR